jgi:hypothetical protein
LIPRFYKYKNALIPPVSKKIWQANLPTQHSPILLNPWYQFPTSKMKFSSVLSNLALGVSAAVAAPTVEVDMANLPGLNAVQTKYANAIIAKAKADGVGAQGCQAAIATAMVEVRLARYTFILHINVHLSLIIRN